MRPKRGEPQKYLKGVYKNKNGIYKAKAYRSGKTIYIGSYPTEQEAHEAYLVWLATNPPGHKSSTNSHSKQKAAYDLLRNAWNNL